MSEVEKAEEPVQEQAAEAEAAPAEAEAAPAEAEAAPAEAEAAPAEAEAAPAEAEAAPAEAEAAVEEKAEEPVVEEPVEEQVEEEPAPKATKMVKKKSDKKLVKFDENVDVYAEGFSLSDYILTTDSLWCAYKAVKAPKGFQGGLSFVAVGDSIAELKASMVNTQCTFYLVKIHAQDVKNNVVSVRTRLMRIKCLGTQVKIMHRRFTGPSDALFKTISAASKDVQLEPTNDCDWQKWAEELMRSGGAHQPTQYVFGPDEVWNVPQKK